MINNKNIENVIIIGAGPAGLASAIYTARAGFSPLVFAGNEPGGQLIFTSEVENYPGSKPVFGAELMKRFQTQAESFKARILGEKVVSVDFSNKPYEVNTMSCKYLSKSVIIATGAKAMWLNLESEQKLRGKGVSACATCDGFFYKNKIVGIVGGGNTALEEALTLTRFASKVYIVHRRDKFRASKIMQKRVFENNKIEVLWNSQVKEVLGKEKVEGIILNALDSKSKSLVLDGLFIAIGHKPDTEIFKNNIALDEKGYILTSQRIAFENAKSNLNNLKDKFNFDYQYSTSVNGVFAAGDCIDKDYKQAATASGMGVCAALEVEKYLSNA